MEWLEEKLRRKRLHHIAHDEMRRRIDVGGVLGWMECREAHIMQGAGEALGDGEASLVEDGKHTIATHRVLGEGEQVDELLARRLVRILVVRHKHGEVATLSVLEHSPFPRVIHVLYITSHSGINLSLGDVRSTTGGREPRSST